MKIPLKHPLFKKDLILNKLRYSVITKFEDAVKKYNNDPDGKYIAVANETNALEAILLYINGGNLYHMNEMNEIIVASWSNPFVSTTIKRVGAKPVWCDVNRFGVPDVSTIKSHISDNTCAIIITHQMGVPCDIDAINELSNEYTIPIIEDGSNAFGSEYENNKIGKSLNPVILSFNSNNILTIGEGAIISVRSDAEETWLRSYIQGGIQTTDLQKQFINKLGGTYEMSYTNAEVGLIQLDNIDDIIKLTTAAAEYYDEKIKELNISGFGIACGNIIPPYCTKYNWNDYHALLSKKYIRNVVVEKLQTRGIFCDYDIQSMHSQPIFGDRAILPSTDIFHKNGIRLPLFADITTEEQDFVIQSLKEVLDEFTIY